jgi:hypothetical protein
MLNDEEVQQVKLVLSLGGWNNVMRPRIENRSRQATKALVLSRAERTSQFAGQDFDTDDDVLRAIIRDCEWMIYSWLNEVAVADQNRRRDELDRQDSNGTTAGANR